jgi:predicted methyltransferase
MATLGPLLTKPVHDALLSARAGGAERLECSLDLQRSQTSVAPGREEWAWGERRYPYPERCKDRTIYYWDGAAFQPAARFTASLVKLIPTRWGPPTFEIDGIKMLPTEHISPYDDAQRKVALIEPRGKVILDTCGGLGYFAAACLAGGAQQVQSYEVNGDVIWLRQMNPWSPNPDRRLTLAHADISDEISRIPRGTYDAVLHDPPRFGIAGDLYSARFYGVLARVLKPGGRLFHYTGSPNKLTSGRDVPAEVLQRLRQAGFAARIEGDGILAFLT